MSEEEFLRLKELVDKCNKCNFSTCEQCEISWNDVQKIQSLLNLYNKQKEEIERLKNAEEYAKLGKETLLDTIHKQQKEIEELKELLQGNLYEKYDYYRQLAGSYQANSISKDKIRERLEKLKEKEQELSDEQGYFGSSELQARIEELEELAEEV